MVIKVLIPSKSIDSNAVVNENAESPMDVMVGDIVTVVKALQPIDTTTDNIIRILDNAKISTIKTAASVQCAGGKRRGVTRNEVHTSTRSSFKKSHSNHKSINN